MAGEIVIGELPRRQLRLVQAWVELHAEELRADWELAVNKKPLNPIEPRYVKAPYGPYAENLRHVLQAVNGHLIEGYGADGDAPTEELTFMPGAIEKADSFLAGHPQTNAG